MRLTLVIYSLSAGGAERVMSILANYWAEKGWQVTLLTFEDGKQAPFYELHSAVTHRPLGIAGKSSNAVQGLKNNFWRLMTLRRAIRSSAPDAVVSFMSRTNVLVLLATLGLSFPVVISERSVPSSRSMGGMWERLRHWAYGRSSCLVVQSQEVSDYFASQPRINSRVIPNPVTAVNSHGPDAVEKGSNNPKRILMSMGRLLDVKGYDLLLRAFSEVAPKHPDWSLVLWGEGPKRDSLEKLREELRLQERVELPGLTKTPHEKMKRADLFVLSSRHEGFPNVLCEAMASGLPVISFDCPCGPGEIIRPDIDGVLVPAEDIKALATAMDRLMDDDAERNRLAKRAPDVLERFGLKKVMGMWEEILTTSPGRQRQ
jgi:glycosyltransferase involved in cell wall biosynthesis